MKKRPNSHRSIAPAIALAALLAAGSAPADSLEGARNILCAIHETHVCVDAAGCADVLAEELNIPRFIRIDTKSKQLSTTQASGQNRVTVADHASRTDGQITLQGVESGRAYSLFIDEETGLATFAAAAGERSLTVFGICTPEPLK